MGFLDFVLSRQLVGLDIGASGIKAVELQGKKEPRLVAYNRVPLPWGTISSDGTIEDRDSVIEALKLLFETTAFSTNKVAVGASGNSIITKKITLPKMSEAELNHQLYFEAEQYIPFDISEVNLDYAVVGAQNETSGSTPMMDVLLVAAKKEYVTTMTSMIAEAHLIPEVIDIQAFALGNVFEFNYGHLINPANSGANVIIDFGAGSTKLSIVERDKTTFTREMRHCGSGATTLISERGQISMDEAEHLKLSAGSEPEVKEIITEYCHEMADEIMRTLDYSQSQSADRTFDGIYICGGSSKLEGLMEILNQKLPAPVHALNPIQNVAGSGKKMNAQAIQELSYLGAVAIGLSLRTSGDS